MNATTDPDRGSVINKELNNKNPKTFYKTRKQMEANVAMPYIPLNVTVPSWFI